jgi:hypothetical protein
VKASHCLAPASRSRRRGRSLLGSASHFSSAHVTTPWFCTRYPTGAKSDKDDAEGLVLAIKWRCFHCHCHDFRFYVTLFPKCFSNFRSRYLFDIGLPTLYLTLADTYLPIDASLPRSATRLVLLSEMLGFLAQWAVTFFGSILT